MLHVTKFFVIYSSLLYIFCASLVTLLIVCIRKVQFKKMKSSYLTKMSVNKIGLITSAICGLIFGLIVSIEIMAYRQKLSSLLKALNNATELRVHDEYFNFETEESDLKDIVITDKKIIDEIYTLLNNQKFIFNVSLNGKLYIYKDYLEITIVQEDSVSDSFILLYDTLSFSHNPVWFHFTSNKQEVELLSDVRLVLFPERQTFWKY